MASKGLWDLCFRDFATYCSEAGGREPVLTASERQAAIRAMDVNYWEAFEPIARKPALLADLGRACQGPAGGAILLALAKGAYFQAHAYWREREWRHAATCAILSARLLMLRRRRLRAMSADAAHAGGGLHRGVDR
jgi:hypothetical protein